MTNPHHFWTDEENQIIREKYYFPVAELQKLLPHRTPKAIKGRIQEFGLCRKRNNCLYPERLLEDSCVVYYWVGFILADGHVSRKRNKNGNWVTSLKITLSAKDRRHLVKFCEYFGTRGTVFRRFNRGKFRSYVRTMFTNNVVITKFIEKFDFENKKTYVPPRFLPEDNNLFLSMLLGMIDGDGNICDSSQTLRVRVFAHPNYRPYFIMCQNRLRKIFDTNIYIHEQKKTISLYLPREICIQLKKHAIKNSLPIMSRKWDKVDENYIHPNESRELRKREIKRLGDLGMKPYHIVKKLGYSQTDTYRLYREIYESSNS